MPVSTRGRIQQIRSGAFRRFKEEGDNLKLDRCSVPPGFRGDIAIDVVTSASSGASLGRWLGNRAEHDQVLVKAVP